MALAGLLNRHQQAVIDYLIEENRVLKDQLDGQRIRFTDDQRIRLVIHHHWYTTTVAKSGSTPFTQSPNSLSNAKNFIRAAVLAEPSPWTVAQGVILLLR